MWAGVQTSDRTVSYLTVLMATMVTVMNMVIRTVCWHGMAKVMFVVMAMDMVVWLCSTSFSHTHTLYLELGYLLPEQCFHIQVLYITCTTTHGMGVCVCTVCICERWRSRATTMAMIIAYGHHTTMAVAVPINRCMRLSAIGS